MTIELPLMSHTTLSLSLHSALHCSFYLCRIDKHAYQVRPRLFILYTTGAAREGQKSQPTSRQLPGPPIHSISLCVCVCVRCDTSATHNPVALSRLSACPSLRTPIESLDWGKGRRRPIRSISRKGAVAAIGSRTTSYG